jgi:hypothetical protein
MLPPVLTKTAWDEQKKLPITGPSPTERTDKELEDILHSEEREGCERDCSVSGVSFPDVSRWIKRRLRGERRLRESRCGRLLSGVLVGMKIRGRRDVGNAVEKGV